MNLVWHRELLVLKATWDINEIHKHKNTPGVVSSNLIFCQNKSVVLSEMCENHKNCSEVKEGLQMMTCHSAGETQYLGAERADHVVHL